MRLQLVRISPLPPLLQPCHVRHNSTAAELHWLAAGAALRRPACRWPLQPPTAAWPIALLLLVQCCPAAATCQAPRTYLQPSSAAAPAHALPRAMAAQSRAWRKRCWAAGQAPSFGCWSHLSWATSQALVQRRRWVGRGQIWSCSVLGRAVPSCRPGASALRHAPMHSVASPCRLTQLPPLPAPALTDAHLCNPAAAGEPQVGGAAV